MVLLLLLASALWLWRVRCIELGPDPDGDAYGHYVIARQLLETPLNLNIHWVWLPLYHVLLAAGVSVGASLDHVRLGNASLSALTPLLLGWGLRRAELAPSSRPGIAERGVPLLAAALATLAPLSLFLGTTAQPEPLFALLLLGATLLLGERRWAAAALALSALVLLRYEAWAVASSVAALLVVQRCWPSAATRPWSRLIAGTGGPLSRGQLACMIAPALTVLVWAALRRLDGGGWFDFLQVNQRFAEDALSRAARPGALQQLRELWDGMAGGTWALVVLGLVGVPRLVRRGSIWLVLVPLAVAGFLLLGWLLRSHLGLSRHWVGLMPFAAAAIANGCAQCAAWLERLRPRSAELSFSAFALVLLLAAERLLPGPLAAWREHTAAALPDRRAAASFLRAVPTSAQLWCDDAAAEVLSGLPAERFVRSYLGHDPIAALRGSGGSEEVIVLSQAERIRRLLPFAELLYGDPNGAGLLGLRVRPSSLPR